MPSMIKVHFELFAAVDTVKPARVDYFLLNKQSVSVFVMIHCHEQALLTTQ